jgi:hypothetical protein
MVIAPIADKRGEQELPISDEVRFHSATETQSEIRIE